MDSAIRRIALSSALLACIACAAAGEPQAAKPHPIDRFKALAGDWSAEGLDGNSDPKARVRYEITAGGNAVVEILWPGGPHEMRTVYYKDGDELLLTHYCASGNHPRMRAGPDAGNDVVFAFDGASNFDPGKDGHMHDARFTFVGPDELRTRWNFWKDGKPAEHVADLHIRRIAVD